MEDSDVDYDDSGTDYDEEPGTPETPAPASSQPAHTTEFLTSEQLLHEMNNLARETAVVVGFADAICRLLLHHFKWNKEKLLEKYYEVTDMDAFFRSVKIIDPSKTPHSKGTVVDTCTICYDEEVLTGLECGHRFCVPCWKSYITAKVLDDGKAYVSCPEPDCHILMDDDTARKFMDNDRIRSAYDRLLVDAFVINNRLLKWCPAQECGRVVKVSYAGCQRIECVCGTAFCFQCSFEWHDPIACEYLKQWLQKCSDDSETFNWISANTKDCPNCNMPIEKNGGCNRILCQKCSHEFCWMCMNPWSVHGYNPCNRFDEEQVKNAQGEQERARALLDRYLHYFNRFKNHQQSLKLEKKLYATTERKMLQMQQLGFSWVETQFLKKAVDVLGDCRRTLQYTYAFAFYLAPSNMKHIFEANQQDLEEATEQLSEFLERDLAKEDLVTLKQKVQDKCSYVDQRRLKLLQHCTDGKEKNEWEYNVSLE